MTPNGAISRHPGAEMNTDEGLTGVRGALHTPCKPAPSPQPRPRRTVLWHGFGRLTKRRGQRSRGSGDEQPERRMSIYSTVIHVRGTLLATKSGVYLPPGPVLIALRGDWPPQSDTPEKQGSIEVTIRCCCCFVIISWPTSDHCVDCR